MGRRGLKLNLMISMPSWWGVIQRFRNGGILVLFVCSLVWQSLLSRWVLGCLLGRSWFVFFRRFGIRRYPIALCTPPGYLHTTFWIHLCYDRSRCTLPLHFLLVQPAWSYLQTSLRKSYQAHFFLATLLLIWYSKLIRCRLYLLVHRLSKISSWDIMWKLHHAQRLLVCVIYIRPKWWILTLWYWCKW